MTTVRVSLLQTEHGQVGASLTSLHCTPLYRVYTTTLLLTTTYPHTTPHQYKTSSGELSSTLTIPGFRAMLGGWEGERVRGWEEPVFQSECCSERWRQVVSLGQSSLLGRWCLRAAGNTPA